MKRSVFGSLMMMTIFSLTTVPGAEGKIMLATGVRYDFFTDDRTPETLGYEVTFPLGVSYRGRRWLLAADALLSSANVYPGDGSVERIANLTDTRLTLSYGLPDLPVGVIFGATLNLPTGKARLSAKEKLAEAGENHDLFEVDDFGAGFNLDLSAGLARQFGAVSVGLNGKYRARGAYDPTAEIPDDTLDPGDEIVVTGLGKWKASGRVSLDASVAYSHFITADAINGKKMLQEGDSLTFGGNLRLIYSIPQPLRITVGLQEALQGKNQEAGPEALELEPENSHGNEFFGLLDVTYESSARFAFRVFGDVRYYGASDRESAANGLPYNGRRLRYGFGPGFAYSINDRLALNGLAKYFILRQAQDILLQQDTTFQGVNLAVGVTYTF